MSPLCPRCGDELIEAYWNDAPGIWAHVHYDKALRCRDGNPPKADGRDRVGPPGNPQVGSQDGGQNSVAGGPSHAANPVRRFFAGPCKRCQADVFLDWEVPFSRRGNYLCASCYLARDTAEGWA